MEDFRAETKDEGVAEVLIMLSWICCTTNFMFV